MWRRMKLIGRALFRRASVGVVLERSRPVDTGDEPETVRVMPGNEIVTIVGRPSELMLYAYGRGPESDVAVVGDQAAVAKLGEADLSV